MSLARTALRLAAIEALNSHPVIARRCEGRVYDSRIGDFDNQEPVPVIVVTTEKLSGEAWNPQNGGAPFDDACDLVLEIAQTQLVRQAEQDGGDVYFPLGTDSELEMALDLIEWCAEQIITTGKVSLWARRQTPAGRVLVKAVIRRVNKRTSDRFSSDETGEKLAIHLLTFQVELQGEDIDMRRMPTGPFATLPDPLRTVAESLPAGSSGLLTCQKIAAELAMPADGTPSAPPQPPVTPVPGTLPVEISVPVVEEGSCAST